jgi:hypothetical protein
MTSTHDEEERLSLISPPRCLQVRIGGCMPGIEPIRFT